MNIKIKEQLHSHPCQPHSTQTISVRIELKSFEDYRLLRKHWDVKFELIVPQFGTPYAEFHYEQMGGKNFRTFVNCKLGILLYNIQQG